GSPPRGGAAARGARPERRGRPPSPPSRPDGREHSHPTSQRAAQGHAARFRRSRARSPPAGRADRAAAQLAAGPGAPPPRLPAVQPAARERTQGPYPHNGRSAADAPGRAVTPAGAEPREERATPG